jgi:hypothetical protein
MNLPLASSSWCLRCILRASRVLWGESMVRRLAFFGSYSLSVGIGATSPLRGIKRRFLTWLRIQNMHACLCLHDLVTRFVTL